MNDDILMIELDDEDTVEDIKVMVCAEKNIEVDQQVLMHNTRILQNDSVKLKAAGIKNDDLILLSTKQAVAGAAQMRAQQQIRA
jgi:hypothetical protein